MVSIITKPTKPIFNDGLLDTRMNLGLKNEIHYFDEIKDIFREFEPITHTLGRFDTFDFISDDAVIELKARSVDKTDYKTTIVGMDKVKMGVKELEKGRRVFFLFGFLDTGLEMWEMEKDNDEWKKWNKRMVKCKRQSGYYDKLHLEIPVERLEWISDKKPLEDPEYIKYKKKDIKGVCLIKL
jgi:hypothetical protein